MQTATLLHIAVGIVLVLAAWLAPRRIARAGFAPIAVMLLDITPFTLAAVLLAVATGRPLFAGVVIAALGAGFCLADHTMRETLREPVVFSESVELPQLFTHPHLYLPFAGPGLVMAGALAALSAALGLLVFEPPIWEPDPLAAIAALALAAAGIWIGSRERPVGIAAGALRRIVKPSGEPFEDTAALGPFATLFAHTVIARAERVARRRRFAAPDETRQLRPSAGLATPVGGKCVQAGLRNTESRLSAGQRTAGPGRLGKPAAVPIIIVQCESFFDARRLSPAIPPKLLAGFAACCASSAQFGRLIVPGWGANTMRAEFAVLTGIPESELGYDRFNPYYALARTPIEFACLAAAPGRVPHDLSAPVRSPLLPPRSGDAGAGVRALPRAGNARRAAHPALLSQTPIWRATSCGSSIARDRRPSSSRSRWAITAPG